jgi:hypothetical protein
MFLLHLTCLISSSRSVVCTSWEFFMVLSSALTNDNILALLLAHYFRPSVCARKYIISQSQIRSLKLRNRRHSCYMTFNNFLLYLFMPINPAPICFLTNIYPYLLSFQILEGCIMHREICQSEFSYCPCIISLLPWKYWGYVL